MRKLQEFRAEKPAFYPDQAVYAAFSSAESGLAFEDLDRGTGLLFSVSSKIRSVHFGAGRCSYYPQNNAAAASIANDKYFTNGILDRNGVPTLGGEYFFLDARRRTLRPQGHERADAFAHFRKLGARAFVKPLAGSRGDFALAIESEEALDRYLDAVEQHYDAVLMQRITNGTEYRIFLLDDEIVYSARKHPPALAGDGARSLRELLAAHNALLKSRGLSPIEPAAIEPASLDDIPPPGRHFEITGRRNLSIGGRMAFETPSPAALTMAKRTVQTLGLRTAAVDLFTDIEGDPDAVRIIEVNSNPSIRLLEELERPDLILKIWRHTFSAVGLLNV